MNLGEAHEKTRSRRCLRASKNLLFLFVNEGTQPHCRFRLLVLEVEQNTGHLTPHATVVPLQLSLPDLSLSASVLRLRRFSPVGLRHKYGPGAGRALAAASRAFPCCGVDIAFVDSKSPFCLLGLYSSMVFQPVSKRARGPCISESYFWLG